jgi:hypothetical protein
MCSPAKSLIALVAVSLALAASAPAQVGSVSAKKEGDERVAKLLKSVDVKYTVDDDGDFRIVNRLESGRTHLLFANSKTQHLGTLEIREVWAVAYSAAEIPADVLLKLLRANAKVKLGAWQVVKVNDRQAAVYSAQIAADTDATGLLLALQAVSETADTMELELTGKDDL